jgi:arylsulfatase A-like enzyme
MRRLVLALALASVSSLARADHPVFSLADNRLLAHVQRGGGLVVVAGAPGFAKYLNGGRPNLPWKLGQSVDGKRVAVTTDGTVRLTVPIAEEQKPTTLWLRASSPATRALEVLAAGKRVGSASLSPGWQTTKVALAGLAPGEVELTLTFGRGGGGVAVEWLQLGGDAPPDAAPKLVDQGALVLPQGGGLAYYVQVPASGRLVGDVVGAGCQVAVRARAQGAKPVEATLAGAGASADLAALAGRIVRLDLTGQGCPEARLAGAALTTAGAAPTVQRPSRPKNVIFWIMDSLRADKVRPFFPGARAEVPNWEKLAKESTIFLDTYVQGNESRASHASLWTSQYVANHRMINDKDILDAKWPTLGDSMKALGLYTSGVSSNGWIIEKWGFGKGWDAYRNHIHQDGGTRGEDVWRAAQASLKERSAKPFFLYLGFVDTHVTWRAHEPWIGRYDTEPYAGPFKKAATDPQVDLIAAGKMHVTDRDKVRIIALYDSDVSYQDDLIGKVRAQLAAWGVGDDTMIVITGDHGDELWEDGRLGHGGSLHDTLVHVPLLIYYPPLFPPGTAVPEGAESVDVLPTLIDALGGKIPDGMQGESLIGLAQGVGRGYPRPSIASQYEDAHGMRLGEWKAILRSGGGLHVYDAVRDHLEKTDLAATRPVERRFLTDALSTFLLHQKEWRKRRWGVASNGSPQLAEDLER